jgi:hypothetical protein
MAHTSQRELNKKIKEARKRVEVGGTYHHYKNPDKLYVVEFVGLLEAAEEVCVGYRPLYGKGIVWVRTLRDFTSRVETDKGKVARFTRVE